MKKIYIIISENTKGFKFLIVVSFLSLFFSHNSLAQNQYELEWSNNYDTSFVSFGSLISLDSEGNVVVTGGSFDNGNQDFLILKYTPGGTLLWSQVIDLPNSTNDRITSLIIDSNDNIFIAGVSEQTQNSISNSVLIKLNEAGVILWQTTYSNSGYPRSNPNSIIVDSLGNTFVLGTVSISTRFKMYMAKFDSDGLLIWDNIYGPNNSDNYFGKTLRIIDNTIFVLGTAYEDFNSNLKLLKYSFDGEFLYSNETFFGGDSFMAHGYIDVSGNSYIGLFGDFKVIKFDTMGNEQWQFLVPTNLPDNVTADKVNDIITDEDGNVYITGRHYGENYDDPDNYTNADLQVNKLASNGTEIYSYRYENLGTNTGESGEKLYLGNNGYLAIGGRSGASADAESEFLAIVLDQLGQPIDILKDYEAGSNNSIFSVVLDDDLNLYVTGGANFKAKTQQYLFTGELSTPNFSTVENKNAPYPNPFSNSLEIDTANLSGITEFTLYNSNGAVVFQNSFESVIKETINTSSFPSGFYFYTIVNGEKNNSGKLIKK